MRKYVGLQNLLASLEPGWWRQLSFQASSLRTMQSMSEEYYERQLGLVRQLRELETRVAKNEAYVGALATMQVNNRKQIVEQNAMIRGLFQMLGHADEDVPS